MPDRPSARAGAAWAIQSVPVRVCDGGERLDQVYRRLLADAPTEAAPRPGTDARPVAPDRSHRPQPPRRGDPAVRTALYARVSTERQERQQTTDNQLAALRAWAAVNDHQLAEEHVFRDEGYSGSRLDRPGLDALRDAVRNGAVGLIAVLSPDRLARRYAYQVVLLEEFRRAAGRWRSCTTRSRTTRTISCCCRSRGWAGLPRPLV